MATEFHHERINEDHVAPTPSCNPIRDTNFHSVTLQCSLVHGFGRLLPTPLAELDRGARGTRSQDSKTKNKRIQGQANLQKIREGREEVTVAGVWALMGPVALCNPSHLSWSNSLSRRLATCGSSKLPWYQTQQSLVNRPQEELPWGTFQLC